jgi:hypothetical protein
MPQTRRRVIEKPNNLPKISEWSLSSPSALIPNFLGGNALPLAGLQTVVVSTAAGARIMYMVRPIVLIRHVAD